MVAVSPRLRSSAQFPGAPGPGWAGADCGAGLVRPRGDRSRSDTPRTPAWFEALKAILRHPGASQGTPVASFGLYWSAGSCFSFRGRWRPSCFLLPASGSAKASPGQVRPRKRRICGVSSSVGLLVCRFVGLVVCRSVRPCGLLLCFAGRRVSRLPGGVRRVSLLANKPIFKAVRALRDGGAGRRPAGGASWTLIVKLLFGRML